jgi:DNA polymerase III gamma/tau subunit
MADAQVAVLKEQVQGVPPGRLARITDVLLESQAGVRFALSRRTTLELTLVRAARAATVVSIDELVRQVQALRGSAAVTPHAARDAGPAPAAPRPAAPRPPETPVAPAAMGDELGLLRAQWPELVEKVGQYAPLAKGYLRDGRPLEVSASRVIIGLDPEFASSKEKLELPRNLKALQKVIDDALHRSVSVDIRVEKGAAAKPPEASSPGPAASPSPRPTDAPVAAGKGKGKQHWTQDPAVKRALETFHGDIVDIRE